MYERRIAELRRKSAETGAKIKNLLNETEEIHRRAAAIAESDRAAEQSTLENLIEKQLEMLGEIRQAIATNNEFLEIVRQKNNAKTDES